jgi:predicted aspartyl protease
MPNDEMMKRMRFWAAHVFCPFSAKGAMSLLAWGNRPRCSIAEPNSAEGAFQFQEGDPSRVASDSRFQRWWIFDSAKPGAFPQAGNETAPLAQRIFRAMRGRPLYGVRGHVRAFESGDRSPHSKSRRSSRIRRVAIMFVLFAIAPLSIFGAAKNRSAMHLPGYKAVRVHYRPMNKMIMSVRINGQPANLLVDTGSNQLILDAEAAQLFGVRPSQRGLRYIRFTKIQGESLPVGFVQNISAGSMSFGSSLVTLRRSSQADAANAAFDGVLGLDILFRHKALINCRTKLVFFKVDQARRINLASVAASEKFTRVPIQREETGALTVLCSIRGQPTRLLVDTGAFVTILHEGFVKSLGLAAEPTRISAQFGRGASKRITAAKLDDFNIGAFKMPPEKFGVAPLAQFALQKGSSKIAGILGMDTLYMYHAIIDLDGMGLFLK